VAVALQQQKHPMPNVEPYLDHAIDSGRMRESGDTENCGTSNNVLGFRYFLGSTLKFDYVPVKSAYKVRTGCGYAGDVRFLALKETCIQREQCVL
jgi:hypothetical protein